MIWLTRFNLSINHAFTSSCLHHDFHLFGFVLWMSSNAFSCFWESKDSANPKKQTEPNPSSRHRIRISVDSSIRVLGMIWVTRFFTHAVFTRFIGVILSRSAVTVPSFSSNFFSPCLQLESIYARFTTVQHGSPGELWGSFAPPVIQTYCWISLAPTSGTCGVCEPRLQILAHLRSDFEKSEPLFCCQTLTFYIFLSL